MRPDSALRFSKTACCATFPRRAPPSSPWPGRSRPTRTTSRSAHAAPLDADERQPALLLDAGRRSRFELAYHGLQPRHGRANDRSVRPGVAGFPSRDAAVAQTRKGLDIFERAIGAGPARRQVRRLGLQRLRRRRGRRQRVPLVVPRLDAARHRRPRRRRLLRAAVLRPAPRRGAARRPCTGTSGTARQIDVLLSSAARSSRIEEHIAPVRPDGLVQTPNIVDDIG